MKDLLEDRQRSDKPSPRIGVAVIGCGQWGPNLIRNFQRSETAELLWICDKEESRLQSVAADLHLKAERTTNYRDLLRDPRVQAVAIATPVTTHHALALDSLRAGKHLLVEKPLARSVEECRQLVELSEERHRVLMVDHTFLFSSPVVALKQTLKRGDLGNILYAHAVRVNLGVFQEDINVLWDLLPHDLSIVQYLLEATPIEVSVQGTAHVHPRFEDVAFLTVYYEKGLVAHFHASWLDPCKIRRMTLVGDQKMAVYDDMDPNEPLRIYDKGISRTPYFSDFGEFKLHYRFGDIFSPRIEITEPLKGVCGHFLDCILRNEKPRSDGRFATEIVRILEAADRSLRNRGRMEPVGKG